jgi:hypothetical protein
MMTTRPRQALKWLSTSAEPALLASYCFVVATQLTCLSIQASTSGMTKATSSASKTSSSVTGTDVASSVEVFNVEEARHGRVMSGQLVAA